MCLFVVYCLYMHPLFQVLKKQSENWVADWCYTRRLRGVIWNRYELNLDLSHRLSGFYWFISGLELNRWGVEQITICRRLLLSFCISVECWSGVSKIPVLVSWDLLAIAHALSTLIPFGHRLQTKMREQTDFLKLCSLKLSALLVGKTPWSWLEVSVPYRPKSHLIRPNPI